MHLSGFICVRADSHRENCEAGPGLEGIFPFGNCIIHFLFLTCSEKIREGRGKGTMTIIPQHPFFAWLSAELSSRDSSHGLAHALRVRNTALRMPLPYSERTDVNVAFVLELAALTHDVADHKYASSPEHQSGQRSRLLEALCTHGQASPCEAAMVILIGQNISFKRECAQTLPLALIRSHGVEALHQRLSDADKLDALGLIGLERLWHYNLHGCIPTKDVDGKLLVGGASLRWNIWDKRQHLRMLYQRHAAPRCDAMCEFREEGQQQNEIALMLMEDVDVGFLENADSDSLSRCRFLYACLPELSPNYVKEQCKDL